MFATRLVLSALLLSIAVPFVRADPIISKSYGYFTVGGRTAEELQDQMWRNGPEIGETGQKHPGSTRIKISRKLDFLEQGGKCRVHKVEVKLDTHLTLPRWKDRTKANALAVLAWNTLSSDIKRHEERHAEIARQWARKLEKQLNAIRPQRNCDLLQAKANAVTQKILKQHSDDQDRFDRVEAASFERRIGRIMHFKAKQMRGN